MDIHAPHGTPVIFANPNSGYTHDQEMAARYLKVGETYTVEFTNVGNFQTHVGLREFPRVAFNSVLFE